jgi:hypothetical protein
VDSSPTWLIKSPLPMWQGFFDVRVAFCEAFHPLCRAFRRLFSAVLRRKSPVLRDVQTAYQTGPSVSRPAEVLHRGFTSGHLSNSHVSLLCLGSNDTTRIVVLALYDHFVCQKLSPMSCQRHLRQMAGWGMRQIPLPATLLLWYDESIALRR